jgi:hypothetical protein
MFKKTATASQNSIHKFNNIKRKLYNFNANIIYCNLECLRHNIIPNFAEKVPKIFTASSYNRNKYV